MVIKLGQEVKDMVTGFSGIAVCRADWLFGCVRIGIKPRSLDKDNRLVEAEFFDEASSACGNWIWCLIWVRSNN